MEIKVHSVTHLYNEIGKLLYVIFKSILQGRDMKIKFNKTRKITRNTVAQTENVLYKRQIIMESIEAMPDSLLDELMSFIQFLDFKFTQEKTQQVSSHEIQQQMDPQQSVNQERILRSSPPPTTEPGIEDDFFDVEI